MAKRKSNYTTPSRYTIAGRLMKDPEFVPYKDKEGKEAKLMKLTFLDSTKSEDHVDFWPVVTVGGARVDFLSKLKKGDGVFVTGKPEIRTYEGKNGWGFELTIRYPDVVEPMVFLADRKDETPAAETDVPPPPADEDIPF